VEPLVVPCMKWEPMVAIAAIYHPSYIFSVSVILRLYLAVMR
jgi:hypothetical protein